MANRHSNGKQPISLISGLGLDLEEANNNNNNNSTNRQRSARTNYTENLLLQQHNNNRNRMNLTSTSPPTQLQQRGQIYSKKSSMDDLLSLKHLSVSPPKFSASAANNNALITGTHHMTTRRVPISRISLKYLRPSLASSTNSLSSVNHSIASSTSSLSDNNNSKSCLKIDGSYS